MSKVYSNRLSGELGYRYNSHKQRRHDKYSVGSEHRGRMKSIGKIYKMWMPDEGMVDIKRSEGRKVSA